MVKTQWKQGPTCEFYKAHLRVQYCKIMQTIVIGQYSVYDDGPQPILVSKKKIKTCRMSHKT